MSGAARLAFAGVGWIGRHRMEAALKAGHATCVGIFDPSAEARAEAGKLAPDAALVDTYEALLDLRPDGVVIATPNMLHAPQSLAALERGIAVFCQKPLARTAPETREVVDAARRADRLLGVDLSYRHTDAMQRIREGLAAGDIGDVYAMDLVFHNAYGPDKAWFYDRGLSGGGCVLDLGIHLVDLALWARGFPDVERVGARLYQQGKPLGEHGVEDYAVARLDLADGATATLACSWRLHAGVDAVIGATFHGTTGSLRFRNVEGSFYDFVAERVRGKQVETLSRPPDAWGGRAIAEWSRRLAVGERFDPRADELVAVADTLDRVYGR